MFKVDNPFGMDLNIINRNDFDNIYGRHEGIKRMGGMLDENELNVIASLINYFKYERILEIGVNTGGTAIALLSSCVSIRQYYGVDRDIEIELNVPGILARGDKRFNLLIAHEGSHDKSIEWDKITKFDLIFIDGDHHYKSVKSDQSLANRIIRKGGVIMFHDYDPMDKFVVGVMKLINKTNETMGDRINMVEDTTICYYMV